MRQRHFFPPSLVKPPHSPELKRFPSRPPAQLARHSLLCESRGSPVESNPAPFRGGRSRVPTNSQRREATISAKHLAFPLGYHTYYTKTRHSW